jgi:hypothetical protein
MSDRLKNITAMLQAQQERADQEYKVFAPAAANAMVAKAQSDPLFGSAHYLGLLGREQNAQQQGQEDQAQIQQYMSMLMDKDIDAEIRLAVLNKLGDYADKGILNSVVPAKTMGLIDPIGAIVNDTTRIADREAGTRKTEAEATSELYDAGILTNEDRVAALQRGVTEPTTPVDSYNVIPNLNGMSYGDANDKTTAEAAMLNAQARMKDVEQQRAIAKIRAASGGGGSDDSGIKWELEQTPFGNNITYKGKGAIPQNLQTTKPRSPFGGR